MNHHLKNKKCSNKQQNVHKCSDTNLHLVVEPDVHEEAVHVGPEQRRANQMRHSLQKEKNKQNIRKCNKSSRITKNNRFSTNNIRCSVGPNPLYVLGVYSTLKLFQSCMSFFLLLKAKEDILENVGNQTVVGSH